MIRAGSPATAVALVALLAAAAIALPRTGGEAPANLHQWGAVTLFHGLPSDHVRAVAQDGEGTLWFGTDAGLARYDGRRIQTVMAARVRALATDPSGALWAGTDDGAVRVVAGVPVRVDETAGHAITAIAAPASGRVLLTTDRGTVFAREAGGGPTVRTFGPEESPMLRGAAGPLALSSVAVAGETLLLGTRGRGVLAVEGGEVREVASRPRPFFVEAIAVDAEGRAWLGAQTTAEDGGVYESGTLLRPRKVGAATGVVNALCFDARGDLWAGTEGRGAVRYRDGREAERITFGRSGGGLRSDRVYAVFVDREGVVWFGTDRGACRYDPGSPRVVAISDEPESSFARALLRTADGRLWCGTNRGLFVEGAGAWRPVGGLERRAVYALAVAADGAILAGTSGGLFAVRAGGGGAAPRAARVGQEGADGGGVRAIALFDGRVYVATFGRGVERLDGDRLVPVWPGPGAAAGRRDVVSLYAGLDARMWIGTAGEGLFTFDGSRETGGPMLEEAGAIWGIDGGRAGALWVAAERGLYRMGDGAPELALDGLEARCVAAGDAPGAAWVGTASGGLVAVAEDPLGGALTSRLDTEHGLPSGSVFALLRGRGAGEPLWIATSRGVARYEPGRVAPRLRVTRVLGDRSYEPAEVAAPLALGYPQSSLVVDVAAVGSRTFPEQFQYAFALFDGEGRLVARRISRDPQFVLEDLRPGRYLVEARAYSNDLVASDPLELRFEVAEAPFPWDVAALSLLLGLSLAALWWGAHQNRRLASVNTALGDANRELAETRLQLANETEAERRRIARDLHDQTLADLRRLLMQADALAPERLAARSAAPAPALDPVSLRAEIEAISAEIRRICEDLSPSVLANVGLTAALEWALADAVAHLPADEQFDYELACGEGVEERLRLDPAEQIQIYRVVQEAINNVCRHAGASRVRLSASIGRDGAFVVELEDDGRGFDPAARGVRSGRGVGNIRSRASMIGAEVSWSRRAGGGTLFLLRKR